MLEHDGADTPDGAERVSADDVAPIPAPADGTADAMSDEAFDAPALERLAWNRTDWYVCLGLMVLSLLVVGLHARAYPTLSPIDELQHVDYMIKAGDLEIPHRRDLDGQEALSEAACRGIDSPGLILPECGLDDYDPLEFPERGVNTAASQYPAYYVATGLGARAIAWTGIVDSKVTAARLIGGLYLGAAWCVTWLTLALLRVPRRRRMAVLSMLVATPLIVFHAATVNADAILLLTGALTVLTTVAYHVGRLRGAWLALTCVAVLAVEPSNTIVVGLCATFLLIVAAMRDPRDWRQWTAPAACLAIAAVFRVAVFPRLQDWWFPASPRTVRAPMFAGRDDFEFSWAQVWEQLPRVFTPISNTYLSPPLRGQQTIVFLQVANWLLIGLLVAAALLYVAQRDTAWFARLTTLALLLAGPLYTLYYATFSDVFYPAPGRFGLPLVAAMTVAAATALRTTVATNVALVVGGVGIANTLLLLAF